MYWLVAIKYFLCSPRTLGKWSNLTAYVSNGLGNNHQLVKSCGYLPPSFTPFITTCFWTHLEGFSSGSPSNSPEKDIHGRVILVGNYRTPRNKRATRVIGHFPSKCPRKIRFGPDGMGWVGCVFCVNLGIAQTCWLHKTDEINGWQMFFCFLKWFLYRGHVSFRGCR